MSLTDLNSSKPKTYLVPERERTEPPPRNVIAMIKGLIRYSDREVINKCGLDAYFFLRYLKTLLVIFIPICAVVMPILIPINYVGGKGHEIDVKKNANDSGDATIPKGLDTLAWGNVKDTHTNRYAAHLLLAILVVIWVCTVFFFELRAYIKVRQDYLTSAEHRLKASATTVLVNSIPQKWLSVEALDGLFDVFPGGVRNVWLNRDLTTLLEKISRRDRIHVKLENAETELIKAAKRAQLKQRNRDEKKARKETHAKSMTKKERADRDAEQDEEAKRMANSDTGMDSGNHHEVPHTIEDGIQESRLESSHDTQHHGVGPGDSGRLNHINLPAAGKAVSKASKGVLETFNKTGDQVDHALGSTNGFMISIPIRENSPPAGAPDRQEDDTQYLRASESLDAQRTFSQATSTPLAGSTDATRKNAHSNAQGNTVRKLDNFDEMYNKEETKIWQFWKPPSGGYASPVPQGTEAEDYMAKQTAEEKSAWQSFTGVFSSKKSKQKVADDYPCAYNPIYKEEDESEAEWAKYLKKKDRPTHRLDPWDVHWLPGLPLFNKKVDTIYWCRAELARLNVEIEEDQKHPERFPLMNSAFVQFNHQVAAHMACQSIIHHIPRQMAPRMNEISPRDVIWDNMALSWWNEWLRTSAVFVVVLGMVFLWAVPVAWTAALSQLDQLIRENSWLSFLKKNKDVLNVAKAVAGVLPAAVLGLLLILIPIILNFLAGLKGAKTRTQKSEFVQIFYFVFLFIQVFLVVSIASFFAASIDDLVNNFTKLDSVKAVLNLLADNLPKAANYFFSYMVLQAMSTSSGTLLQLGSLFVWFTIARIVDSTARNKWARNTTLNQINWGSFFPVYTNFACIALIYCIIAPLISVFAIITFSLLWLAQRYAMVYVNRFEVDTGGILYPRAINQTFTGIYFMELCMAGLFFITKDHEGKFACTAHGAVMMTVLVLTIIYQILLNMSFSPLFRYLPITFEDEAVLRDEAFQRAQDVRFGLAHDDTDEDDDEDGVSCGEEKPPRTPKDATRGIELDDLQPGREGPGPRNPVRKVGTWAKDGGRQVGAWARGGGNQLRKLGFMDSNSQAAEYRRQQRKKDLESQQAIGEALYGGIHDEIEDLTPDERDVLVRHAFQHSALRARRPTVWIPRDDLGISDDEIRRTREYSKHVWISNEGTALDSKVRVVYGRPPPDFSEMDVINL